MTAPNQDSELRRKNIRLALLLGGLALFFLLTSFPFWMNLFSVAGDLGR
ncbi:MAG: hypothetical protein KDI43_08355 [Gammaproteobacteria bacterium]|nr:hypothetical protein [Gammaproteobacteria bacterium]MCP5407573.1 hypothetical protein [Chromatiaceae bacterium]MCP5441847.1 hypothetical protein [Chromatiaceae bacterium]